MRVSVVLTSLTASLVANAMMSAQDTMPGQTLSTAALAVSMRSKPRTVRFAPASFSAELVGVLFINNEASHPCQRRSHN